MPGKLGRNAYKFDRTNTDKCSKEMQATDRKCTEIQQLHK